MSESHSQFVGSIPENYDAHLGPLFFHWYANDIARRISDLSQGEVLETACGTGIVTRRLRDHLSANVNILATDLNDPMLEYAQNSLGPLHGVSYQQADATALPFDDNRFEAVVCQFGIMFFPDKQKGLAEAARVLKPGGRLLFNVWDSFAANPIPATVFDTIKQFFDGEPPSFFNVPFGFSAIDPLRQMVESAGLGGFTAEVLATRSSVPTAVIAARGMVQGSPLAHEIEENGNVSLEEDVSAAANALAQKFGDAPLQAPLQAVVMTARKPA